MRLQNPPPLSYGTLNSSVFNGPYCTKARTFLISGHLYNGNKKETIVMAKKSATRNSNVRKDASGGVAHQNHFKRDFV